MQEKKENMHMDEAHVDNAHSEETHIWRRKRK
jgi:hypothetical protein